MDKKRIKRYDALPKETEPYQAVIGVDIGGGKSKDAIAVIQYHKHERKAWTAEEKEYDTEGEDIETLAVNIKYFYEKYKPNAVVIDTGGVGNRIAGVLSQRYGIPQVIPAIKVDKMSWLETMKAEAQRGRLLFKKNSLLMEEADQIIYSEDKTKVDDENGLHSDILDAVLYAFRFVYNEYPEERPKEKSYKEKRIEEIMRSRKKTSLGY